eukprot:XP_001709884.1 Hypothetical protein GL50803_32491 [Giardia lamblia ATCC 50803]
MQTFRLLWLVRLCSATSEHFSAICAVIFATELFVHSRGMGREAALSLIYHLSSEGPHQEPFVHAVTPSQQGFLCRLKMLRGTTLPKPVLTTQRIVALYLGLLAPFRPRAELTVQLSQHNHCTQLS